MPNLRQTCVNKRKSSSVFGVWFLLMLYGCGVWVGNPKDPDEGSNTTQGNSDVAIAFEGDNTTNLLATEVPVIGTGGAQIGVLSLNEARLVLKEIRFKFADNSQSDEDHEKFEGPYIVDLLANTTTPSLGTIKIPNGEYKKIELKLHKLEDEDISTVDEGDELVKNSIHLQGTYTPTNGSAEIFFMTHDFGEEFEIETATGSAVEIEEGVTNKIAVAFKIPNWFDFSQFEEDFSDLEQGSDIRLDKDAEDEASKVRDNIKEAIKASAKWQKE